MDKVQSTPVFIPVFITTCCLYFTGDGDDEAVCIKQEIMEDDNDIAEDEAPASLPPFVSAGIVFCILYLVTVICKVVLCSENAITGE